MEKKTYVVSLSHDNTGKVQTTTCTIKKGSEIIAKETVKRYYKDEHDPEKAECFATMKALDKVGDYKEKAVVLLDSTLDY